MKSQMTIGKKLMLGFAGLMGLLVVLGFTFLNAVGTLKDSLDAVVDKTAKKISLAGELNAAESDMLAWQRGMILFSYAKDARVEDAKAKFRAAAAIASRSLDTIQPLLVDEEGRRIVESTRSGLSTWATAFTEIERLCGSGDPAAAWTYAFQHTSTLYAELDKGANRFVEIQEIRLQDNRAEAATQNTRSRWIALLLLALSLALGAMVLYTVRQITCVLQQVAREMADGANQVASAATQVAASSQALAQGSSEQAASIEETSAATEEIHSMARRNTENSGSAATLVAQSQQQFDQTKGSLEQMVTAMTEITASSGKISKIIKVIDEIAFQTNILALNAAVEAARAGEAGLGFAVVADEVRNLAQRSAQAAKDTADLIEDSVAKSNAGKVKVDQVAGAIRTVTEEAGKIKILVDEISVGSQEQARGIEQISTAITQMDQVTQKSAASAEESAAAAEELTAQSESLKTVVGQLLQMVGGGQTGQRPKPVNQHSGGRAESGRGLAAMASAVSHHAPPPAAFPRALAGRHAESDGFPMDTEF